MSKHQKPYLVGSILGLVTVSLAALASVPRSNLGQETAAYPELTEIRGRKVGRLNFDGEIARLTKEEARFRERLPSVRRGQVARSNKLSHPMNRIASKKYRR